MSLLRVEDVEGILGVGDGWVYRHLDEIPHIRLGAKGLIRFRSQDVEAYIASKLNATAVPATGTTLRPSGRRRS